MNQTMTRLRNKGSAQKHRVQTVDMPGSPINLDLVRLQTGISSVILSLHHEMGCENKAKPVFTF